MKETELELEHYACKEASMVMATFLDIYCPAEKMWDSSVITQQNSVSELGLSCMSPEIK